MRSTQTGLGPSARTQTDCGTYGFGEGEVDSDHPTGRSALRTPSVSTALGWGPWAEVRLPMHTNLPGSQNPPFRASRAHSSCKIAPYPGRALFWPPRGARWNLGVRFRLIRAVSTRRTTQSCIDPAFWAEQCWAVGASRMAARARTREVLRPDRPLKANARSPPGQMACLSSPVSRRRLGSRTAVLLALLVVYNDDILLRNP